MIPGDDGRRPLGLVCPRAGCCTGVVLYEGCASNTKCPECGGVMVASLPTAGESLHDFLRELTPLDLAEQEGRRREFEALRTRILALFAEAAREGTVRLEGGSAGGSRGRSPGDPVSIWIGARVVRLRREAVGAQLVGDSGWRLSLRPHDGEWMLDPPIPASGVIPSPRLLTERAMVSALRYLLHGDEGGFTRTRGT